MVKVTFTVDKQTIATLRRMSERQKKPQSAIFRHAIKDYADRAGKLTTRHGTLLAELVPTPKVIAELRAWFPHARLAGWKFELEGNRAAAIAKAEQQITENRTDACVANGRAYGDGFGLVTGLGRCRHLADVAALYAALAEFGEKGRSG